MEIKTKSSVFTLNKKNPFTKWLLGYTSTGAWTGTWTLQQSWKWAEKNKIQGVSWYALGVITGVRSNELEQIKINEELKNNK